MELLKRYYRKIHRKKKVELRYDDLIQSVKVKRCLIQKSHLNFLQLISNNVYSTGTFTNSFSLMSKRCILLFHQTVHGVFCSKLGTIKNSNASEDYYLPIGFLSGSFVA